MAQWDEGDAEDFGMIKKKRLNELRDIAQESTGTCRVNWPPEDAEKIARILTWAMWMLEKMKSGHLSKFDRIEICSQLKEWDGKMAEKYTNEAKGE